MNIDLYADDSTMFKSGFDLSEIQSHLQTNLDNIARWCTYNNMSLHPKKTKCMIIGSKHMLQRSDQLSLKENGTILDNVNVQKVLGVFVDNTLNWHAYIDYM